MIEKAKQKNLNQKIIEVIINSSDIDEILSFICSETAKFFNVQRVTIASFPNNKNYEDCILRKEFKISPEIKGVANVGNFPQIAAFWGSNLMKCNKTLAYDNIETSDTPDYFKNTCKEIGIKSIIGTSIGKSDDIWGTLVLSEYNNCRKWEENQIELLETVSKQIYITIRQFELYEQEKKVAEREALLRKIMLSSVTNLDIKEVINSIVTETGKLYKADRCFFVEYDPETKSNKPIKKYSEYLSSKDICSHTISAPDRAKTEVFDEILMSGKSIAVNNVYEIELPAATKYMLIDELSVKSYLIAPVHYGENIYGSIVLHCVNEFKQFTQEEIDMAQAVANQSAIVMHQARLHELTQVQAQRESVLRGILASAVNNLDMREALTSIVTQVGKLFCSDRCFFIEIDIKTNSNKPIKKYAEYLSSKDIISHNTRVPTMGETKGFVNNTKKRKIEYVDDITKINLPPATREMLDYLSVKSFLIVPVSYGERVYGAIVLHFVNEFKQFSRDELDLAQAIADQSAIVISQIELYSTIEANEKYTKSFLDNINDGIISISDDFTIETCNPAVESIWGYSIHEILGKKLDLLLHFECENIEKKFYLSKKESFGIKKNGEKFPVEIDVSEIDFENKKVTLLVIRDITERKKIDKMKNEFVSTVSHELRTPLTSIKGSLGLIISGAYGILPQEINKLLDIANNNCLRLTNLINDILDLEKIKAGKYEFIYEELEINSIINQSVVLNQSYSDQFGIKIEITKSIKETYIKADKDRILQVMSNLISNAVKFSNPDGKVTITAETENNKIKVSIKDNGIGIPEDSKHKIFKFFSQVDSSDTRSKGGTGLGLSICKLIVENMGGEIDFESEEGKGSTFYFSFPRIQ